MYIITCRVQQEPLKRLTFGSGGVQTVSVKPAGVRVFDGRRIVWQIGLDMMVGEKPGGKIEISDSL